MQTNGVSHETPYRGANQEKKKAAECQNTLQPFLILFSGILNIGNSPA